MISPTPTVTGVIINPAGNLLLLRRSSKVLAPGTWCSPGGDLEGGLDWIAGLRKTIEQEVGLSISSPRLFGVYAEPSITTIEEAGQSHYFVTAAFLIRKYQGDVRKADSSDSFDWFSPDSLPSPMLQAEIVKIQDALAFRGSVFAR